MKRVFIIHGWGGAPTHGWKPWLKTELEKKKFEVNVPSMPDPENPQIETWVTYLSKIVGDIDENTFFIGHSMGCQTILRYLESLPSGKKAGGAVFVAGFFTLKNLEEEEEEEIAKLWLETPINFDKIKKHTNKFIAIFSDNDQWVPMDNKELFEQKLGARTFVENQKGHFSEEDGIKKLPIALRSVLEISS